MNWEYLYTTQRLTGRTDQGVNPDKLRTSFMRDYDRLIFSAAFRKLQNKTQVFPLPGVVFVHNRLTHSLEVASVGRSLGRQVGSSIARQHPDADEAFLNFYNYELGNVITSACLAHDIGNPPFGHSGEDAIRNYFRNVKGDIQRVLRQELSREELADFEYFEGNSNALRVLTHTFNEPASAYNLTLTTLASIIKYPTAAHCGFRQDAGIVAKKAGYFQSEKEVFHRIMSAFHLKALDEDTYVRHPFVFLTEAADDICYRVIDIEDAERLGIVSLEEMKALFLPCFAAETGFNALEKVTEQLSQFRDPHQQAQYIRARWIGLMVEKTSQVFMEHQAAILAGTFGMSLLDALPEHLLDQIRAINRFSVERIYNHKNVIEVELAGFNVIGTLLDAFIEALVYPHNQKSVKLLQLVEPQYKTDVKEQRLYDNILSVIDFISGMTDNHAIDLYRKIKGIDITGFHRF